MDLSGVAKIADFGISAFVDNTLAVVSSHPCLFDTICLLQFLKHLLSLMAWRFRVAHSRQGKVQLTLPPSLQARCGAGKYLKESMIGWQGSD